MPPEGRPDRQPERLVIVTGTGTDIGKTWTAARLLAGLRAAGAAVAARKPAQSHAPGTFPGTTDAAILGAASGESREAVCPPWRWYGVAMAPPMAAEALGLAPFTIADVVAELRWPADWPPGQPTVGLIETVGGVRSPLASDGDTVDLVRQVRPHVVVLVADAGLGTINAVRLSVGALETAGGPDVVVVLNRFSPGDPLHEGNRRWLTRLGLEVFAGEGAALVDRVLGSAG